MADVFEDRRDLDAERERLWDLIEDTPKLDWLLLTKRPQNIAQLARYSRWPRNVWLGVTAENQKHFVERMNLWLQPTLSYDSSRASLCSVASTSRTSQPDPLDCRRRERWTITPLGS